jgi:hypothetical protein
MALSRGHHVPKFYLRGFTVRGDEYDDLFVYDQLRRSQWTSSPVNAAKETGMYATDCPTPGIMEQALSSAETIWQPIISDIISRRALPNSKEAWTEFLGFIACAFLRAPRQRERVRKLGPLVGADADDVENLQLAFVWSIGGIAADLVAFLRARHWTLWTCEDTAPDLICSDHPVSVTRSGSSDSSPEFGLGTPDTIVSMPINRRSAVVGVYGETMQPMPLSRSDVARMNSATAMYAHQIYSSTKEFVWMRHDFTVGTERDFFDEN